MKASSKTNAIKITYQFMKMMKLLQGERQSKFIKCLKPTKPRKNVLDTFNTYRACGEQGRKVKSSAN